jgi:hypothetical protein
MNYHVNQDNSFFLHINFIYLILIMAIANNELFPGWFP